MNLTLTVVAYARCPRVTGTVIVPSTGTFAWLKPWTWALFDIRSDWDSPRSLNVFQDRMSTDVPVSTRTRWRCALLLSPLRNTEVITCMSSCEVVTSFMSPSVNETTSPIRWSFFLVVRLTYDAYRRLLHGFASQDVSPEMTKISSMQDFSSRRYGLLGSPLSFSRSAGERQMWVLVFLVP